MSMGEDNYWQALMDKDLYYPRWLESQIEESQKYQDSEALLKETDDKGLNPF